MKEKLLSEIEVRAKVAMVVKAAGGQHAFADQHKVSQSAVSFTVSGWRHPSPSVLAAIGIEALPPHPPGPDTLYREVAK